MRTALTLARPDTGFSQPSTDFRRPRPQALEKNLSIWEPRYQHVSQEYGDVVEEPCLDKDEKKAVEDEMDDLHAHWADVNDGIKAKKER